MKLQNRKGVTLLELLIAASLLAMVALAAASIDISAQRFFHAASDESELQMEMNIAMEHIVRNLSQGVGMNDGSANWVWIWPAGNRIMARIDSDGDGVAEITDTQIEYRQQAGQNTIQFDDGSGVWEDIAEFDNLTLTFAQPDLANKPNLIIIEISGAKGDEQMRLRSRVFMRGFSTN